MVSQPRHGPATCKGAAGCSQGPPTKGRTAVARPPARGDRSRVRPAAAKAPLQRGDRLRPSPLQGAAARGGNSPQEAATRKGRSRLRARPPTVMPQGAATHGVLQGGGR
ncbi:hypothetical protein GW17_00060676 [Ensete ventricosum]|nr:hypothetical protein GW17_00060676 [Ensete ventricosum]